VVGSDADIVSLCAALNHDPWLPCWILIPKDTLGIDHYNVELLVAVDIDERDGVTDRQAFFDFLRLETDLLGRGAADKLKTREGYEKSTHGYSFKKENLIDKSY